MCTLKNEHVPPNGNTRGYMYPQTEIWVGMLLRTRVNIIDCTVIHVCRGLVQLKKKSILTKEDKSSNLRQYVFATAIEESEDSCNRKWW